MTTSLEPTASSVVMIKIGNREYPAVQNKRCGVCMHPARFEIESRILQNYSYPSTSRWVSERNKRRDDGSIEDWPELTSLQIKTHIDNGHCPLDTEMVHELARRRSQAAGFDLEKDTGQFVDHVVAGRIILQRGMERIIKGEVEPDVKDVLAVAKLQQDLENNNKNTISTEQYQELFLTYFRVVQELVSEDQWTQIMRNISEHPVVRAFQARRAIEGNTEQ